jgi:heterodisulfide reductase subunit A
MRNIFSTLDGSDPQKALAETVERVLAHDRIRVFLGSEITDISGYVGNFSTTLVDGEGQEREITHGVVIVATGGLRYETTEYLYGESSRVVTLSEFEGMMHEKAFPEGRLRNVVMVQCVGSREEGRMYCSRICCSMAVKNALQLKKIRPNSNVYFACRDIRTYGFSEEYYTRLRDQGALFLRYSTDRKPGVEKIDPDDPGSRLRVTVYDTVLEREEVIDADLLVLATAIEPPEDNRKLAQMLKVPLNSDGLFLEAHVKLRPVDFATDGVFVCGLAHGPKSMSESVAQSLAAAGRALTFLSKKSILAEGTIAQVRTDRCSGCGYCESACAYAAIEVDREEGVAVVNDALCKGCGACVASCRCGALDLRGFTNGQLFSVLDSLVPETAERSRSR